MDGLERLRALVPDGGAETICWEKIERALSGHVPSMAQTPQNPRWHGEGDVWTHTKLVCQALVERDGYRMLERGRQELVFLAALLHDVGKPATTRLEDGQWTSPNHSVVGAKLARQILWLEFGLGGTEEKLRFRETVCALVRYHTTPPHAVENPDGKRRLLRIAANGELIPDFSLELLCLLSEADALGRYSDDRQDMLERVVLCRELASEAGCLHAPFQFPSAHSRYACFSRQTILPGQPVYDDTWGPVILLSGLPGTGKDTWIRENCPELPVISLDELRRKMKVQPGENQGPVVEAARELAREYLRKKEPFIWNATDLSSMVRRRQIELFTDYHAAVKVVYLETDWQERVRRNGSRAEVVPEQAVCRMLEQLVLPEIHEAHEIIWQCV